MERKKITHESFGMITYSKTQGGKTTHIFGSSIDSNNKICLSIHNASLERDLNNDWYYPENVPIVEVIRTPNQFSEFLTSPNTTGVPCTITYKNGHRIVGTEF